MCTPSIQTLGAKPAYVKWTVVRGDTGLLEVNFLESDEVSYYDTEGWSYSATAYDPQADVLDELIVVEDAGKITIKAPASLTEKWGSKYNSVVSELRFDLQVTIPADGEDTIWTPVIGTICVLGDITPGGSL